METIALNPLQNRKLTRTISFYWLSFVAKFFWQTLLGQTFADCTYVLNTYSYLCPRQIIGNYKGEGWGRLKEYMKLSGGGGVLYQYYNFHGQGIAIVKLQLEPPSSQITNSFQGVNDVIEIWQIKYSELSLRRTPSGPIPTVRLREVSSL